MPKTRAIRNLPEKVYEEFAAVARRNHRNAEAHGRFLIERETARVSLETCGEILDAYVRLPPPNVEVETINLYQAGRGRRSPRS